jgi:hypothetical protein
MFKNVASQKIALFAYDSTTGAPKTGDAANITPYVSKDYGTVTVLGTTTATEMDATNAKGWYSFVLTQAETNGDALLFTAKSSTANAFIVGFLVYTDPASFTSFVTPTNLTAAQIATGVWQDTTSGDFTVASSIGKSLYTTGNAPGASSGLALVGSNMGTITGALTGAQIATAVWTDTTAGDFTTALSVGKSVMNGVSLGTGLTVNALTTNNDKTGYSLTQSFPSNFSSLGISAGGHISNVDTLTTYTGNTVQTGDAYARLGAPAGASTAADIAAVKTDTAAVKVQTDKMTFTVANQIDANPLSINGSSTAASNLAKSAADMGRGTCTTGGTTTSIATSAFSPGGAGIVSGQFIGRTMIFDGDTTTAQLRGQATNITANTSGATPTFTVTALTAGPASGDTFSVV